MKIGVKRTHSTRTGRVTESRNDTVSFATSVLHCAIHGARARSVMARKSKK